MVKNRSAITLFITLTVIVAMIALVGIVFSYLTQARQKAESKAALIEANLIYADASTTVKKFVGKKPSVSTLSKIYELPLMINEKKGSFNLMVACTPSRAAIPISWFSQKGGASGDEKFNLATMVFDAIAINAHLKDEGRLKAMITEAVDSKYTFEFGKEARLQKAKRYFGWVDFRKLLDTYALEERDPKVYNIDWQKYFSFGRDYDAIDGNFLSSKLVSIIFNIDEQIAKEEFKGGELKNFLNEFGGDLELYNSKIFDKGAVDALTCNVNYAFGKGSYSFKFNYTKGKVDGFEFTK